MQRDIKQKGKIEDYIYNKPQMSSTQNIGALEKEHKKC